MNLMPDRLFHAINLGVACVFALFLYVQFNDPDSMVWLLIYGLAALACVLFHLKRLPPAAALGYAVIMVLVGTYYAWSVISQQQYFFYEEGREAMGSILVACWMLVLYVRGKRVGMQ